MDRLKECTEGFSELLNTKYILRLGREYIHLENDSLA